MNAQRIKEYEVMFKNYDKDNLVYLLSNVMELMDRYLGLQIANADAAMAEIKEIYQGTRKVETQVMQNRPKLININQN